MTAALLLAAALAAADPAPTGGISLPLWTDKVPHAVGTSPADQPKVEFFRATEKVSGAAVIICPGGGYGFLSEDHEGRQAAKYFNNVGVHAFVLKSRIVQKDRPGPLHQAPLIDAQRAIRFARANAKTYDIDPTKVGLMGFSAGGHLASTAGTHFDAGKADGDAIDKESCRPDFLILCYPVVTMEDGVTHAGSKINLLGKDADAKLIEEYSNEKHVTNKTPPTFLFHTDEDKAVLPENSIRFYAALKKANVPAELHIYEKGRHGIGLGTDPKWTGGNRYTENWSEHLTKWLQLRGALAVAK